MPFVFFFGLLSGEENALLSSFHLWASFGFAAFISEMGGATNKPLFKGAPASGYIIGAVAASKGKSGEPIGGTDRGYPALGSWP